MIKQTIFIHLFIVFTELNYLLNSVLNYFNVRISKNSFYVWFKTIIEGAEKLAQS